MFVLSPHSSSSSWMPDVGNAASCSSASSSKRRVVNFKRKREGGDSSNEDADGEAPSIFRSLVDAVEPGKRSRIFIKEADAMQWSNNSASGSQPQAYLYDAQMSDYTIDYKGTHTRDSTKTKQNSSRMNVEGDSEMSDEITLSSTASTPAVHNFFANGACFRLSISTPTGHPHPYDTFYQPPQPRSSYF